MKQLTTEGTKWLGSYGSDDQAGECSWQRDVSSSEFSGVLSIELTDTGDLSASAFQRAVIKQLQKVPPKPGNALDVSADGIAYFTYAQGQDPVTGKQAHGCDYGLAVEPKLSLEIKYQYFPGTSDREPAGTTSAGSCQRVVTRLVQLVGSN